MDFNPLPSMTCQSSTLNPYAGHVDVLVAPRVSELARRFARGGAEPLAVLADPTRLDAITQPLDGVDVILATSGSTDGTGRLVGLSTAALTASAHATHDRLGGPGQWLATLTADHVAGFQLAFRSALARTEPIEVSRWDDAGELASAIDRRSPGHPLYASYVPAQLRRLLELAPELLTRLDAVLIGGAALPAPLAERAADAGIRVVRTYGMTETGGGCIYDGVPLDGVTVRIADGKVQLGGVTLMTRYLDSEVQPFLLAGGTRWLTTADLGRWREDGRLEVLGRADSVIISGGVNVPPRVVEECLEAAFGGAWGVIGMPDIEWGERVVAVTETPGITLEAARAATSRLGPAFRPREIVVGQLPRTALGKLDRRTLRARLLASQAGSERDLGPML